MSDARSDPPASSQPLHTEGQNAFQATAKSSSSATRLLRPRDRRDLDPHPCDEIGANGCPHGLHTAELALVDLVELGEVVEVDEVDEARDDVAERGACALEQGVDVAKRLLGLLAYVAADDLAAGGIEAALAGEEDPPVDLQRWRIGADGDGALSLSTTVFTAAPPAGRA